MAVNVDDVFKEIGDFGSYQKRIYFLLCLPILFVGAGSLAYVFIAAAPEYRCLVPKCDINRTNPTYNESFIYFTIPYLNASANYDECHRYQRLNDNDSCLPEDYSKSNTTECPEGKVFADDVFVSTIVTEFNLTCHNAWKSQMAQTVYFAGVLVGAFSFGIVADLTGRRVTIMIVIIIMAVSGITIALVPGLTTFNVLRFINAMATTGLFQTSFVLGMEFVGPSKRVMCGIIGEYFFALGEVLLGLIAWWLKDWRMIQLLISAPVSCFIFYWWFIPESPRWLHAQGKDRKLVAVLEKVAKGNNKTFSPLFWNDNNGIEANDLPGVKTIKVVTLLDILKTPLLCCRMFSMFFIWAVTTLVYYGLSINSTNLSSSNTPATPYLNFILSALVEIPGYTLAWMSMSLWGRKGSLTLSMILAGISCAGAGFLSEYNKKYLLILVLLGKCFITCAFAIIYIFTSEMFPTSVRSTIVGLCSTFARIGAMLAPFSNDLALLYGPLPMIVFGALSVASGLLSIIMPETLNTSLPDTLADALHLRRAHSLTIQESLATEEEQNLLNNSEQDDDDDDEPVGCINTVDVQEENSGDELDKLCE